MPLFAYSYQSRAGDSRKGRGGAVESSIARRQSVEQVENAGAMDMTQGRSGRGLAVLALVACLPEGGRVNVAQSLER
jgi:hypothetical protein